MKIDRHNYEEFFILYWDNELSASQKQAVEDFIKANPDLQEEFNIVGDTRFTPDSNIQLKEKDFLFNDSFINVTNYEEQLLNYIDDELTTEQNADVEKAVAKFPTIKKELALLYKTKLQPESTIAFPDKSVLYRREEKVPVISMAWFRVAVAAALILIAGFITFRLVTTDNSGDKNQVVINDPGSKPSSPGNQSPEPAQKESPKNEPADLVKSTDKKERITPVNNKKDQKLIEEKQDRNLAVEDYNKNNLPTGTVKDKLLSDPNIDSKINATYTSVDITPIEQKKDKVDAVNTSFEEPDVTLKAGHALNIQTPTIVPEEKDGGGLKEFLRKTTRVFERRTKIQTTTEDNKLLLGAFAVSLK